MQNFTKLSSVSKLLMCASMSALISISSMPNAIAENYNYYKSTGANGEVFFTQFARRDTKNELISKRSDGRQEETGEMDGKINTKPIKKKTKQELRLETLEAQDKKRKEQEKVSRCQKMRENLTQLNIGGKLYKTSENGERSYMTDQEIEENRQKIQGGLDQFCKGI